MPLLSSAFLLLTHLPQIIPVAQLTLFKNFSISHIMFSPFLVQAEIK